MDGVGKFIYRRKVIKYADGHKFDRLAVTESIGEKRRGDVGDKYQKYKVIPEPLHIIFFSLASTGQLQYTMITGLNVLSQFTRSFFPLVWDTVSNKETI